MWRKSGKYNLNTALKLKKMNQEPRLYFNPLIFFLARYIILLGVAILKHLGWAPAHLVCTNHRAVLHALSLLREDVHVSEDSEASPALLVPPGASGEERCGEREGQKESQLPPSAPCCLRSSSTNAQPSHTAELLQLLPASSEVFLPGFVLGFHSQRLAAECSRCWQAALHTVSHHTPLAAPSGAADYISG